MESKQINSKQLAEAFARLEEHDLKVNIVFWNGKKYSRQPDG